MTDYTFKIGGVTQSLGVMKEVVVKRITNKFPIPPMTSGETVEILNWGETYREFQISGIFNDTEANINTFITNIETAERNLSQCYISSRFTGIALKEVIVTAFDYIDGGGTPGYITYTLVLTEALPIV